MEIRCRIQGIMVKAYRLALCEKIARDYFRHSETTLVRQYSSMLPSKRIGCQIETIRYKIQPLTYLHSWHKYALVFSIRNSLHLYPLISTHLISYNQIHIIRDPVIMIPTIQAQQQNPLVQKYFLVVQESLQPLKNTDTTSSETIALTLNNFILKLNGSDGDFRIQDLWLIG